VRIGEARRARVSAGRAPLHGRSQLCVFSTLNEIEGAVVELVGIVAVSQ